MKIKYVEAYSKDYILKFFKNPLERNEYYELFGGNMSNLKTFLEENISIEGENFKKMTKLLFRMETNFKSQIFKQNKKLQSKYKTFGFIK